MALLALLILLLIGGAAWYASGRLRAQEIEALADEPEPDPVYFPFLAVYFTLLIKLGQSDGHIGADELEFARRHLRRTARVTTGHAFSDTDLSRLEETILLRGHELNFEDTAALVREAYSEIAPLSQQHWFFEEALTALASLASLDGILGQEEDDLLLVAATTFGVPEARYSQLRARVIEELSPRVETASGHGTGTPGPHPFHPATATEAERKQHYGAVLGLKGRLTKDELRKRYRSVLALYHPDKTAHLGPELRALAEQKTKEIVEAYGWFARRYRL